MEDDADPTDGLGYCLGDVWLAAQTMHLSMVIGPSVRYNLLQDVGICCNQNLGAITWGPASPHCVVTFSAST